MGKLFGTDGVRGIANKELTSDLAYKLGQACAYVLAGETKHTPKVLVGTDTRISCDMLESALYAGLCSVGSNVIQVGVIPTPGVAYLTRTQKADVGVVISASHNSFEFNGIKFFDSDGYKLSDDIESQIEEFVLKNKKPPHKTGDQIGRIFKRTDLIDEYAKYLVSNIDMDISNLKVLVDCANGASYEISKKVFDLLKINATFIYNKPNGININDNCGSTHIESLQRKMLKGSYDIGFAYDGDADRVLAVSEKGKIIDGDKILGALAIFLKDNKQLKNGTMVSTIMSNMSLEKLAKENNIKLVRTKVGDRYVVEEMRKNDYIIGGEQSGHIILMDYNTTGDGILVSLKLLSMMKKKGMKASDIGSDMIEYPQVILNAKVKNRNRNKVFESKKIMEIFAGIESDLANEGRIIIRPSGTEPLIRVMIEGESILDINEKAQVMVTIIEEILG